MNKRFIVGIGVIIALATMLMIGCKKSDHSTLVALGDEHYMKSINDIYPKTYRDQWNSIVGSLQTPVYEGIFPPNLIGEYVIKGDLVGGNEVMHQPNGDDISGEQFYPYYKNQYTYFTIKNQKNGVAQVYMRLYFPNNPSSYEEPVTDSVYIFGNGATGEFTMVFDATSPMGIGEQYYGFLITGKRTHKVVGQDTIQGIQDIRRWHLVKGRTDNLPQYYYTGGQRLYKDISNFAEKVEYNWDIEGE